MSPFSECILLSINLFNYVINKFQNDSKFDFDLFKLHVGYAQKILDDVIDLEIEKINSILKKIKDDPEDDIVKQTEINLWKKIKSNALNARRTGLGITALGDMIAAMNLRYGTDEANEFTKKVFEIKAINEYKQSCILAKERGAFPDYTPELEEDDEFMNFLFGLDEELKTLHSYYGRRNISISTIAPGGSVSLMTQTTSGLEPAFNISYKRKRKINPNDKDTRASEPDANGDYWETYNVFHPKFVEWYDSNWFKLNTKWFDIDYKPDLTSIDEKTLDFIISKSPYYKATANEIDWIKKVEMQGIIQRYVSHSLSVTHNLPNDVTVETVDELYKKAWEVGCKGFTIYRDGSRSGVLINKESEKPELKQFITNNAQRRPSELVAKVIQFQNNKEQWIGFIGVYKESEKETYPYEIFTGKLDDFNVPGYVEEGIIKKIKDNGHGSRYDFIYKDKQGYEVIMQGLNRVFDREAWNMAKLISSLLRHRHPMEYVIKLVASLKFENDEQFIMTTWKKGVIRILKKFVKDGVEAKGQTCENCGSSNLIYTDGCLRCLDCGASLCG